MNRNLLLGILSLGASTLHAALGVETVFQPVALSGQVVVLSNAIATFPLLFMRKNSHDFIEVRS